MTTLIEKPLYAPLSESAWSALLKATMRGATSKLLTEAAEAVLLRELTTLRPQAFQIVDQVRRGNGVQALDLPSVFGEVKNAGVRAARWREIGLLVQEERGLYEATSVAALLLARLTTGERERMPSITVPGGEPRWWCWSQESPTSPRVAQPVPLAADLAPGTLLWTPWAGAAWAGWVALPEARGAVRWSSTPSEQQLASWIEWAELSSVMLGHADAVAEVVVSRLFQQEGNA